MVFEKLTWHPGRALKAIHHWVHSAYPAVRTFESVIYKVGLNAGFVEHRVVIASAQRFADVGVIYNFKANDTIFGAG